MFPQLPALPSLESYAASTRNANPRATVTPLAIINPGGGGTGGGGFDLGGILGGILGGGSGGTTVNICSAFPGAPGCNGTTIAGAATSALSSALGIPAINWGRIAAFLLGLILIAGGLYLIKPVQEVVNRTVKETVRSGAEVAAA